MAHRNVVLAGIFVLAAAAPAAAETKSWAAMKSHVPTNTQILVGVDFKAMNGATFGKVVDMLVAQDRNVGQMVGVIKQTCSLDPTKVISDLTVAIKTKGSDEITIAFGLDGVDEAKLIDCATKIMKDLSQGKAKVVAKPGKVSEYTFDEGGKQHTVYAVWPSKDVFVVTNKAEDKATLDRYTNGKAVQGDLKTYFDKLSTGGTVGWVAAAINEDKMKGAYGSASVSKGTVTGAMHVVADNEREALKALDKAKADLAKGVDKTAKLPVVQKVLKAVKMSSKGAELSIEVSLTEADIPDMVTTMLQAM